MANVFYLDVDDEITSAAARIRASKDPRVGLVVPPGSRIATSRINFRLLAREALERNRALSIVSSDPAARALAASAGLPAFATVADFEADQGSASGAGLGANVAAVAPAAKGKTTGAGPASVAGAGARRSASSGAPRPPDVEPSAVVAAGPIGARSSGASAPAVRPAARKNRSSMRVAAGAVAVLVMVLVLALIGAFFLPSATITVTPKVEAVTPIELSIRADPNATASDPVAGVVPATVLTMDFTSSNTFNATGVKVTTTPATGTVQFTNNDTGGGVPIPAGSKVSTGTGTMFATTDDVTVPRAQFQHGFRPGTATVGVSAVTAGTAGNVPAGAIDQVPSGYNSTLLNVNNPSATSGGTRTSTTQIQKKDTDAAMAGLTKDLKSQFTAWLAAPTGLAPGSTAFPKTGILGAITPDNDPTALIGTVQPTFELTLTATGTVTAVDQSAVTTLATTRLQTTVTPDYSLVPGSTKVTIGTPRADTDAVVFPVTATASQIRHLDPDTLRGLVSGKSVDEAKAILASYGTVDIQTWPGFVGTVPSLAWRLTLTVEGGAAGASSAPSGGPPAPTAAPSAAPSVAPTVAPSVGPSSELGQRSRAA